MTQSALLIGAFGVLLFLVLSIVALFSYSLGASDSYNDEDFGFTLLIVSYVLLMMTYITLEYIYTQDISPLRVPIGVLMLTSFTTYIIARE